MKILQVNNFYNRGSTGKIVYDLNRYIIKKGHQSIVCYGRGPKTNDENVYKISTELEAKIHGLQTRIQGLEFSHSFFATNKLISIIKSEKPDVVHLHCLNCNFMNTYRTLDFLKKNKINTVLTLHAELMHTGGCGHAYDCQEWKTGCKNCVNFRVATGSKIFNRTAEAFDKMKKAFDGFDTVTIVAVSPWLSERAKQSPIMQNNKHLIIDNGINTDVFRPRNFENLKEKYNIPDTKIILHTTPDFLSDIKGGKFVLKLAERMKETVFVIVGFNGNNKDLPKNVIPIKHTQDKDEMAQFYSMADLTLLTSKRETFSMVCAESLCCGTPVVGFKAGGPETISIPEYSEFVEYGNIVELEKAVMMWLDKKSGVTKELVRKAGEKYSSEKMAENYIKLYRELSES